jgi:glutamine amidotransferase
MGWNQIDVADDTRLFQNLPPSRFAYFVHSYHCILRDRSAVSATTDYDGHFTSGFEKENLFGLQFHPEKSQELGLQILRNFAQL